MFPCHASRVLSVFGLLLSLTFPVNTKKNKLHSNRLELQKILSGEEFYNVRQDQNNSINCA